MRPTCCGQVRCEAWKLAKRTSGVVASDGGAAAKRSVMCAKRTIVPVPSALNSSRTVPPEPARLQWKKNSCGS